MFGKQGKAGKAPTSTAIMGKKNAGKVVGAGGVKQGTLSKGTKGNTNKLKERIRSWQQRNQKLQKSLSRRVKLP